MLEIKPYSGYEAVFTIAAVIVVLLFLGLLFLFMTIYYDKKKRKAALEKKLLEESFSQTLLQTRLEIQEETFKTISQEIHDNIGQSLSFIKLRLSTMSASLPLQQKNEMLESKDLLSKTIQDLRDIARSLNPDFINEAGLDIAIKQQLQILEKSGAYQIKFYMQGEPYKHEQQKELVVFRIVQELLNNMVKHAEASEVHVTMNYETNKLMIAVKDNGKGFDTSEVKSAENNNGLGLRNMQSRMKLINGMITIKSKPGEGTEAVIEV